MSQRIVTGVPNEEVPAFCRLQSALGATKCEATRTNGTSDVLVEYPDRETFDDHKARTEGQQ